MSAEALYGLFHHLRDSLQKLEERMDISEKTLRAFRKRLEEQDIEQHNEFVFRVYYRDTEFRPPFEDITANNINVLPCGALDFIYNEHVDVRT
jgi:hypothetical protein